MDCDDGLIGCLDDELDRVAAILGDHGVALVLPGSPGAPRPAIRAARPTAPTT